MTKIVDLSIVANGLDRFAEELEDEDLALAKEMVAALDARRPTEELLHDIHRVFVNSGYLLGKYSAVCQRADDVKQRHREAFEPTARAAMTGRLSEASLHAALLGFDAYRVAHERVMHVGELKSILNHIHNAAAMCQFTLTEVSRIERSTLNDSTT